MKYLLTLPAMLIVGAAWAGSCPVEMKAIDAKIATKPQMSTADMDKVKALRTQGEQLHKDGKHAESMKALGDAKKMLGI